MDVEISEAIREDLATRWNEPHRRHHNRRHLDEVLASLRQLHDGGLEFDERAVVLAAWFHDAVYETLSADNERDSAALARRLLVDDPDADEVVRLVELTLTHDPSPNDRNGIALSDADLSVLGAAPARYREYSADVREEYHLVPDDVFRPARRALLADFIARDTLFRSPQARQRWETPARENIAREIEALA
ncbi:HD domain-containing protein [Gordonia sp. (in: high G+C Gram-positive bacteria)]|uniref:HD domain-containing protein n=1 Tax=Gordonia sp. (in: high G+C Gram-positive bacteria) TaxID=84139 RepID=UPI003F9BAFEF